ncbi:2-isopropylmalate synthase [Oleidesulfovibrio sp.]|uniref:2-isopropylmalate synthase n=1 Tax=Oleidesulfovibrio sp. TaxID=2909707 RepID=UPI003A853B70
MADKLYIFDTTLRDGEQSPGATMNIHEKVQLARQLENVGVDIMEAGFPAASSGDFEAVKAIAAAVKNAQVAGLCRAVQPDIDRAWDAIKGAVAPRIHTFIATSPVHMEHKLRKSPEQVIEMAREAVRYASSRCLNVEFSAEDASRSDWDFLTRVVETAIDAGATTINIPDTVGYAQPDEFGALVRYVMENARNSHKAIFSVHCHNDLGLAVANTLAAVKAGARQAEVTISGIGERAGNAALEEIVMALRTRQGYYNLETSIKSEQLFPTCRLLSMIIGQPIPANKAIVGANAFAHESGIHQDGMLKNRETYEIMTPESVGRTKTEIVLGKHSGRNAIKGKLEELGYQLDTEQTQLVFEAVKKLADRKKQIYDEDMEALVLEEVFRIPDKFKLIHLSVQASDTGVPPSAAIVMEVAGERCQHTTFGVGPIDAVFNAISQIVGRAPQLRHYSVNAITGGTDAQGEVTVKLQENGSAAVGRGADADIITASAKAYLNALNRLAKKEQEDK